MSAGAHVALYEPRHLFTLTPDLVRGWTVKRYGVCPDGRVLPEEVLDAGRLAVERTLPELTADRPPYAFSVSHRDDNGCYYIVAWWAPSRLVLCTRHWHAARETPSALLETGDQVTACVWEMVVMSHESRAWVRHVLRPTVPGYEGYVRDVTGGVY